MERVLLLVDDEENVTASLERVLRGDGYTILRASSGNEGLAILAQREVGVVISDQRMPGMTGAEFLSKVKQQFPRVIRMLLSGYTDLDTVKEAINHGAISKFLTKPWDNEAIRSDVLEAFGHYELMLQKDRLLQQIQSANELLAQLNTELAKAMEQKDRQIDQIIHYDTLTGLPNRALFLDRLGHELTRAHRDKQMVAVLSVNLVRFKHINESFGYQVGDHVLKLVADRLFGKLRACDTVARMAGDEFGIVLTELRNSRFAGEVAKKIVDSFALNSISLADGEIFLTVTIGISIYPVDGDDSDNLLKNSIAAMYHARKSGHSNILYYAEQMNASAMQHIQLETELRRALAQNEFVLYYQPKVDMPGGKIVGMEALLRWQHPERGLVAPGEFIPLLEETGLILPVGEWVLREACKQACAWQSAGFHNFCISVNLSAMQFRQPDFAGVVLNILKDVCEDSYRKLIELELTESMLMDNVPETIAMMEELHTAGIRFAIDDFGTGYSSLSYLKRFPISSLKIDQSFVRDLAEGDNGEAIVAAVIALGHSLGLKVVAEGVETMEQLAKLNSMGCNEIQGYLFSRPVPADKMTLLLQGEVLKPAQVQK